MQGHSNSRAGCSCLQDPRLCKTATSVGDKMQLRGSLWHALQYLRGLLSCALAGASHAIATMLLWSAGQARAAAAGACTPIDGIPRHDSAVQHHVQRKEALASD
jgi:hypothetical protein